MRFKQSIKYQKTVGIKSMNNMKKYLLQHINDKIHPMYTHMHHHKTQQISIIGLYIRFTKVYLQQ